MSAANGREQHKPGGILLATVWLLSLFFVSRGHAEQITEAHYLQPVVRYGHFALGKPHEYARIEARTNEGRTLTYSLPDSQVFEDLNPRLIQLSPNADAELLTIVSERGMGARLAVLGLVLGGLQVTAQSRPIGTHNRWLNPVGVADLDGDGRTDIAAVTTPHIGGVLRVYRRHGNRLAEIAHLPGFSNHAFGSAELGLSRAIHTESGWILLVPDATRQHIRLVALEGNVLVDRGRCEAPGPVSTSSDLDACERLLSTKRSSSR